MEKREKILVIRFSSIGDIVLTTPIIRCLKKQKPNVEIHFLVKKSFLPVVENNPYIDNIHVYTGSFFKTLKELKEEHLSHIVDLQNNIRSNRLKFRLGVPLTTVNKINFKKWLMVAFKINVLPSKHIVERYFDAVKPLGVYNDNEGLDFFVPSEAEKCLDLLPSAFSGGYLTFIVGAAHNTKQIPVEKAVEILNTASKPVILLGGTADIDRAVLIEKQLNVPVLNLTGKTSLSETAVYLKKSKVAITPDTGSMHIASALYRPVISLWGNTIPEFGMYPYMPKKPEISYISEVKLTCRPCTKIGYRKCPRGHFRCMLDQDVDAIVKMIDNFWNLQ